MADEAGQSGAGEGEEGAAFHGGEGLSQGGQGAVRGERDDAVGRVEPVRPGSGEGRFGREPEGFGEVDLGVGVGDRAPLPLAYPGPVAAGAQAAAGGGLADPAGQDCLGEAAGAAGGGQRVNFPLVHPFRVSPDAYAW